MKKVLLKWKKEIKKGNTRKYEEIRPKPIFKKLRKVILRYLYLLIKNSKKRLDESLLYHIIQIEKVITIILIKLIKGLSSFLIIVLNKRKEIHIREVRIKKKFLNPTPNMQSIRTLKK